MLQPATDARGAIEALQHIRYDLVITDLHMPGDMDGQDLFRWIKEQKCVSDVILLSGAPTLESALEAFRYGAWDYLIKPLDIGSLRASVSRCLQRRLSLAQIKDPKKLREALFTLYRELNAMQGMRGILSRYLSKDVTDKVLGTTQSVATLVERREVSVLFVDIRNFTPFAESRSPEEVVATLNSLFERFNAAVARQRGVVDKYTGDGIMVVFGAPRRQDDHVERAAYCALDIMQETAAWNADRVARDLPPLEIGIGINTGEVVVGNVGSAERSNYTVIGSKVNLAARLQEHARAGQILIGPATAAAISLTLSVRSREKVKIRGFSKPIAIFELDRTHRLKETQ